MRGIQNVVLCLLTVYGDVDAFARNGRGPLGFAAPVGVRAVGGLAFVQPSTQTSKPVGDRGRNGNLSKPAKQGRAAAGLQMTAAMSGGALPAQAAAPSPPQKGSEGSTVGRSIFNLIKNIVGAGILAVPGGVNAFSQSRSSLVPAIGLIVGLGSMSGYCFSLIGRVCAATGASSYGEAWSKTIGEKSSWLATASCTAKTFFACMAYSIIVGDVFSEVLKAFGASGLLASRSNVLCLVSATVLFPLCLLKDLSALSYTSILGVLGTVYTACVMGIRYFDKSYLEGGKFFAVLSEESRPWFGGSGALNPLALILLSMLSTAFVAHFNAPKFYADLKDKTVERYNTVVASSFGTAIALVVVMTLFPFLTFGGASKGFILNNYATTDALATTCRLAVATSIVGGYPLVFMPAKNGALALFGIKNPTETQRKVGTALLLAAFTAIGVTITDLGFVVSFGGAVLGSALVFIYPTMMWIKKCRQDVRSGKPPKGWRRLEMGANYVVALLGVLLAVLGGGLSIKKSFF